MVCLETRSTTTTFTELHECRLVFDYPGKEGKFYKIKVDERKKMKLIACIFLFVCCAIQVATTSCSRHYWLKKNDANYIPYKGNEVLVLRSDKNRMDTIFLTGKDKGSGCAGSNEFFTQKCEGLRVNCTRTDPNYDRYLASQWLVEVMASQSRETRISFDIALKGSWFYNTGSLSLQDFDALPNTHFAIDNTVYNDVKIIEAGAYAKQFEDRNNYAERFYWSVSKGFLGLDRRDEKWRLVKIYEP
jgi:hypothetical protein